ncbi:MAG: carbohydrate binding domain-containing protein [Candidatus Omnitrophota bacterium]
MKRTVFLFSLLFAVCFISVACQAQGVKKALLVDDFEGEIIQAQTIDAGTGNGSSLVVSADADVKQSGSQSLKLDYDAVAGGYMWVARGYGLDVKGAAQWLVEPDKIDWTKYGAISFYFKGTGSNARVAFDIKDSGGEMFRFMVTDDTQEWKQMLCPFDEFFARGDWQPDNAEKNAILDFPVKSFQFEFIAIAKGTANIDEVQLEPLN